MTIADDEENPKPVKKLAKSLGAIAALRIAMEQRLAETQRVDVKASTPSQPPASASEMKPEPETPNVLLLEGVPIEVPKVVPEPAPKYEEELTQSPAEPPASEPSPAGPSMDVHPKMYDPAEWSRIMFYVAERSQKLVQEYLERNKDKKAIMPTIDPAHLVQAFTDLSNHVLHDPEHFVNAQLVLWQGYAKIWQNVLDRMQGKSATPVVVPSPADKRFKDKEWQTNWMFDFIKQSYLLTSEWVRGLVHDESEGLDPRQARKLEFYTRQMVDAIAPNNFWLTNPEVLRATLESNGENLVKGLENLLGDLERGHGRLNTSLGNTRAFEVGVNLATTPGKVIYQNDLMQLIQYEPQTPSVFKTPLLLVPPWINKFYILDLQPKNSFIGYLVAEGYTVFCVSWVNPNQAHAKTNFDDYMSSGMLAAMREVKRVTGEADINILGYCIGGTLLAGTLAYLKALPQPPDDLPNVRSATYLVTMVDFSDPGDLGVFVDKDQVKTIDETMAARGYFEAANMSATFNLLRANDLIWSFVVNNYLLGKDRFPFDILYWNGDSTNLPASMHSFYLHNMYLDNKFCEPNGVSFKGVPLDVRLLTTPSFLLSTRDDHIAPWKSTYASTQLYKGPVKFVLSSSGHVAGIINPPSAKKYGYWTNDTLPAKPDVWLSSATQHQGSWWPEWLNWLKGYAGEQVPARRVGEGLENAPGSYVKVKAI